MSSPGIPRWALVATLVAFAVTSPLFSVWLLNWSLLTVARIEYSRFGVSTRPRSFAPSIASPTNAKLTFERLKVRLSSQESDLSRFRDLSRADESTWSPSEIEFVRELVHRNHESVALARELSRMGPITTLDDFENWGRGGELPNFISLLHIGRLLTVRTAGESDHAASGSSLVDDFTALTDLALAVHGEPYIVADLVAHELERQSFRLLRRNLRTIDSVDLVSIATQLSRFQRHADPIESYGSEVAAASAWGFSNQWFFSPLITSDGVAAVYLDCQTRILKLTREEFSTAESKVAEISSAPPLSRDLICRLFADGIFSSLVRYELHSSLRQLVQAAVRTELEFRTKGASPPVAVAAGCFAGPREPGGFFPNAVQCEPTTDECVDLKLVLPERAAELVWSTPESCSRFLELTQWRVCAKRESGVGPGALIPVSENPPLLLSPAS